MNVYVAYLNDRHIDPIIEVYKNRDDAIFAAREFMKNNMAHPEHIREKGIEGYEIWLGYLESDCAYVVETELQLTHFRHCREEGIMSEQKCETCKNWIDATAECAYLLKCSALGTDPDLSAVEAMDMDKANFNECTQYN